MITFARRRHEDCSSRKRNHSASFHDYVCSETARGLQLAQMDSSLPIIFCVLTCETLEQAIDRAGLKGGNKGFEAGLAAIEMAQLSRKLRASGSMPHASGKPRRK